MERRLNWIPDPAPTPPRNHGKEIHPPPAEPRKLPRKMRPRRKRKEHHHHLGASESAPGASQPPRCSMSASVKSIPSLPSFRSIHSLPAQQPITIQHGLISWTGLNLAGYTNRPAPASARIPQPDLVETTSPGLTSPSNAHIDLIETTSLGRPVGLLTKIGI